MSENEDSEKTEQPTDKRLHDAREEGNVPRSRELATAAATGAGAVTLLALGEPMTRWASEWMRQSLTVEASALARDDFLWNKTLTVLGGGFLIALPLILICVSVAVIAHLALGGFNFSGKAMTPNFARLDPLKGFGRLISTQSWVEVGKGLLKFTLVGGVAWWSLRRAAPELSAMSLEADTQGLMHGVTLVRHVVIMLVWPLIAIALFDVPWQWFSFRKRLRMSRDEIKREARESEGNPEVKARIRQVQHAMARKRMMEAVPTADVVLVNPTHYAVALRYERGKMRAPVVVAKGTDLIALAIRELAEKHRVPVVASPPLARALYRGTDLGQEIPAKLYAAVAQILSYVYQLKTWRSHGGRQPTLPTPHVDEE